MCSNMYSLLNKTVLMNVRRTQMRGHKQQCNSNHKPLLPGGVKKKEVFINYELAQAVMLMKMIVIMCCLQYFCLFKGVGL